MGLNGKDVARFGLRIQQSIPKSSKSEEKGSRKYHNEPTTVAGIKFDSHKEAKRYAELIAMQRTGTIRNLKLQAQYTLQESYITPDGERIRAIRYVADFAYERPAQPDCTGTVYWLPVVEDVKSSATKTAQYEIKRKLLRERFGLAITEV